MLHIDDIRSLYEFDSWAQRRVFKSLEEVRPEDFQADLGSSHGGMRGTLVHSLGATRIWLHRWQGDSPTTMLHEADLPTFADCQRYWSDLEKPLWAFIETLTEEKLSGQLAYKDLKGNAYTQPLSHQMQHLVNHSSYHRGQVVALQRQCGYKAIGTDMIAYYREKAGGSISR